MDWKDSTLSWNSTSLPWKDRNMPWNDTAAPWNQLPNTEAAAGDSLLLFDSGGITLLHLGLI